ncbi:MAG: transglycosylase SLT domain-containing protein [Verrucomicrobiales bacterium]|nr:transglycosylase SLT domain-containing protein [Verrucomicrobiales bacterium]
MSSTAVLPRRRFLALSSWIPVAAAAAQTDVLSLDDLIQSGKRLADEHLDPRAVKALEQGVDPAQANRLLRDLQKRFQGEYVVDVARARGTAQALLPVLENLPATRPYAAWLRPRMDYFDVADQLEVNVPPPQPGKPASPKSNPSAEQERRAWSVEVAGTPAPKGAAPWVPKLKPLFRGQRVPQELVWVAEVESSFDPQALSPAGAAGLYQLMPATAQSLGLKLSPQDERLSGEKNARAAAGYLRTLYQKFRDWRLTLASYNAGPGRVGDLLKQRGARTFDQISPYLPSETQMYVPRIEAVIQRREGRSLLRLPAAGA